ncbi:hypothetical protein HPB51_025752 [Rhipicephalus microplus]|uniref:t-SNARE coiled-coil homology domain-containing protein n=1 Tax=Rhipicephalus microplus TaxID=6941 RepID=A0A9J6F6H6_RHIMP|nr:hypothetical protein HPB51_025752 [Rhipicephalus microplus]
MASAGRGKAAGNPFFDDETTEDVDDFTFLNSARKSSSPYSLGNEQNLRNRQWEQQREQLLLERQQLEDSILQSSNSAVRVLYDTEQVGIATAEELAHQGEQLKNVDRKLDTINTNLKVSQKHLNSMKSIFGSIKSYFRGGSSTDASRNVGATAGFGAEEEEEQPATDLQKAVKQSETGEQCVEAIHASCLSSSRPRHLWIWDRLRGRAGGLSLQRPQQPAYKNRSAEIEQKLDSNLAELDSGLGRLKFLAQGLGKELDDQNELLDNLTEKTDLAEGTVVHQNSQIRRILKK